MSATEEQLDHVERLQREVADLMAPLRQHYEDVSEEINALDQRLKSLRKTREEIRKLIRVTDPDFALQPHGKNGQGPQSSWSQFKYSPERVAGATAWFQEHAEELNALNEGTGFYATQVTELYEDAPSTSQSSLSKLLQQLHTAGIVRLVKSGGVGGRGGRKFYKVVA